MNTHPAPAPQPTDVPGFVLGFCDSCGRGPVWLDRCEFGNYCDAC
jgi:hypothetical protein